MLALAACGGGGRNGGAPDAASTTASTTLATAAGAAGSGLVSADSPAAAQAAGDRAYVDALPYSTRPDASLAPGLVSDQAALTHHALTLGGRRVGYTATAGHLLLHAGAGDAHAGQVEASVFYVAYTLDGEPSATRPVTFFWNGGPGSSAIYLHLGAWGPRTLRVDEANLPMDALARAPSFQLDDNVDTLLGDTDMVFIDPVGTGWSEAVAPWHNRDFQGVDADARSIRDFIQTYLRANRRERSPKYLYGESYGGIRTPIVARMLLVDGPLVPGASALDGIVLNSPILSYKSSCYMRWYSAGRPMLHVRGSSDLAATLTEPSCAGYIPSYMMVHWAQEHPDATLDEASSAAWQAVHMVEQTWAPQWPAYRAALAAVKAPAPWHAKDFPAEQQAAFQTLADATGLSSDDWARAFNMNVPDFDSALLRLDAARWNRDWSRVDRYNAMVRLPVKISGYVAADGSTEKWASGSDYLNGSLVQAARAYMSGFLQYRAKAPYAMSVVMPGWDWHHDGDLSAFPQSLGDLSEALDIDPRLQVLVLHGEQDTATPFYQTVLDLRSVGLAETVPLHLLPGGHMLYLTRASHDASRNLLDTYYAQGARAR